MGFKKKIRKGAVTLLAIFIVGLFANFLLQKKAAEAAWADDSYKYRQKFSFTHNAEITSERAITFSLDTAELITAGLMQSDCDDTRFTDINGKVLKFQLTGTCNNAATTYEVVFPNIINGINPGYVYYGNSAASSASQNVSAITALTPSGGDPAITDRAVEEKGQAPVAYYGLDDGSGTTTQDKTLNNKDGTLTNGPVWMTEDHCIFSKCLKFDGDNDHISVSDGGGASDPLRMNGANALTISAWIYIFNLSDSSEHHIISKYSYGGNTGYDLTVNSNGTIRFCINGSANCTTTTTAISANQWYHLSGVFSSGTTLIVYINGLQDKSTSISSTTLSQNTSALVLGTAGDAAGDTSWTLSGKIDEAAVFNYARSAAQIKTDYNVGKNRLAAYKGASASFGGDTNQTGPFSTGLVGYWNMDDSATPSTDNSGNGGSGTWNGNTASSTTAKYNKSLDFDGTNDSVNISDNDKYSINTTNKFTVAAWVNPDTLSGAADFVSKGTTSNYEWALRYSGANVQGILWQADGTTLASATSSTLSTGSWQHIAMTVDLANNVITIYKNGDKLTSDTAFTGSYTNGTAALRIGERADGSNDVDGKIDEVRIYNRVLSEKEIRILYEWAPGPVAYWKFDERSGTSYADTSGNSYSGSIQNGSPSWTTGKYGGGIYLDGTDNISGGDVNHLDGTSQFTLSFWSKKASSADQILLQKGPDANNSLSFERYSDGVIYLYVSDGSSQESHLNDSWSDNAWHHFSMVYDGTQSTAADRVSLYVDGVKKTFTATGSFPTLTDTNTSNFNIGYNNSGTDYSTGSIDDIRIYQYARSQKQIIDDMNAGHSGVGSPIAHPLGHWKFDEGVDNMCSGGTNDVCNAGSQSTAFDGTKNNMASPATSTSGWNRSGKFHRSLAFDGTDDYVSIPDADAFTPTNITLSAWIKWDGIRYTAASSKDFATILSKTSSTVGEYMLLMHRDSSSSDTDLRFYMNNSIRVTWSNSEIDTNWHLITATYDGSTAKIFFDGKERASASISITLSNSSQNFSIGRDNAPLYYWGGQIDEVKFYNYALSSDEIRLEYNQGKTAVFGALSTSDDGKTASFSTSRAYCVPGDTSTCNAPVGEWKLDEHTGTSTYDTSGNANTGSFSSTPLWVPGKNGSALKFDGTDDYVNLGSSSTFALSSFTVSAWVKKNTSNTIDAIVWHGNDSVNTSYRLLTLSDGTPQFTAGNSGSNPYSVIGSTALTNNIWYHLSMTFDGSTLKGYVNGMLVGSDSIGSYATGSVETNIGRHPNVSFPYYLDGTVDQVRIYDFAQTQAQVVWDYNRGDPIAWYKLDECTGPTVNDSSGNSYSGTITIGGGGSQTSIGTCVTSSTAWGNGANAKINSGLNFDGNDDYATSNPDFNPGTNNFSFALWAKTSETNTDRLLLNSWNGSGGVDAIAISINANSFTCGSANKGSFTVRDSSTAYCANGSTTINDGAWHHLVGVRNGNSIYLYVDGKQDGSATGLSGLDISPPGTNLNIGAGDNFWFANALLDDVRIYNYALTQHQINLLYNNNAAIRFAPLTGTP